MKLFLKLRLWLLGYCPKHATENMGDGMFQPTCIDCNLDKELDRWALVKKIAAKLGIEQWQS